MMAKKKSNKLGQACLRKIFFILTFLTSIFCFAQPASTTKWVIKSNNAKASISEKKFTYYGSVEITTQNAKISCEKLEGRLNDKEEIEELVATGAVHLINDDGAEVFGQKAVFSRKDRKITVTGSPKIIKDRNSLEADEIIYYIDENRFDAKGQVETVIIETTQQTR